MKILIVIGFIGIGIIISYFAFEQQKQRDLHQVIQPISDVQEILPASTTLSGMTETDFSAAPAMSIVARDLVIPWDIAFLPDDTLLISERDGTLIHFNRETGEQVDIPVPGVTHSGEGGLLGMVIDPHFADNQFVYVYITSTRTDGVNSSVNSVQRFTLDGTTLTKETPIIEGIPGSRFHNGGRIAFGPDGLLYITTGDARDPDSAQDLTSYAGKILRIRKDGRIPNDNPSFGGERSAIYSYGHRNPQGLTWDTHGRLWSTEHGRTTLTKTGMDELNYIEKGGNYGWPESEGDTVLPNTTGPASHSGPTVTWAPGSAAYIDLGTHQSIFFGGLKGETLYEGIIGGDTMDEIIELREHFVGEYGRIRTVLVGPDGFLYITTSNRDGRGNVQKEDDKIIRLNPQQFNTT